MNQASVTHGASRPTRAAPKAWPAALIAAHVVVGGLIAFVALWRIGVADAAPDEFTYRSCAAAYLQGHWSCNLEHPLLAKELIAVFLAVGGNTITVARFAAALAAMATALWCYLAVADRVGRWGGLAAGAMWGLLPQAGVQNGTTIEALRVDRFALLDPFVACFFALALFSGGRWRHRGGTLYPLLTGAALAAAACAKAPGSLIAPVIVFYPLIRRAGGWTRLREGALALLGAEAVMTASYGPLGLWRGASAIVYMFSYQTSRVARLVVVGGRLTTHAPWWSDLSFAFHGLGPPLAVLVALLALLGAVTERDGAVYALSASASVLIGVGFGLHLSAPQYWVDWEPGVVVAAGLGLAGLARHRTTLPLVAAAGLALASSAVILLTDVARQSPGPYSPAARVAACRDACVTLYVAYVDVLADYLPANEWLATGPPLVANGALVTDLGRGTGVVTARPRYVVIDPASLVLHPAWVPAVRRFESEAGRLGYRAVPTGGRVAVYSGPA